MSREQTDVTAMERMGRSIGRHPWRVILVWLVGVGLSFAASLGALAPLGVQSLFDRLQQSEPYVPGESHTAGEIIRASADAGPRVLVRVDGLDPAAPAAARAGTDLQRRLADLPRVAQVMSPWVVPGGRPAPQTAALRSTSAPGGLVVVRLDQGLSKSQQTQAAEDVTTQARDAFSSVPGARVSAGGAVQLVDAVTHQVEADLRTGEGIALPLSLIVMVFVFAGFVAAGVPIVGAIASIGGGLGALLGFSHVMDLDATVVNIVTLLGLGLCIDYGLLIVSRFREEVVTHAPGQQHHELDADQLVHVTARTVATAGRTVLFSGLTVGTSIAGLLLFPAPVIRAVGIAGVVIVVLAVLVALTLVPACCRLAGRRLARKADRDTSEQGVFSRLARWVQRHVALVILACTVGLVVLALPTLSMTQVSSSTALMPADHPQRTFLEGIARDYPATSEPTVQVVGRTSVEEGRRWVQRLAQEPGVASVDPLVDLGDGHVVAGLRTGVTDPTTDAGRVLVERLRADREAFPTWVTGQDAKLLDYSDAIRSRAPAVVAVVGLATIVLLFLMTGSLVLPLKALVFNVLSLGASLGAIVWIFQEGHLEGLLGFTSTGGIESVVPVIMLTFGFGLSMDYEVFLLSRIVELHEQGLPDAEAVVQGVQRSGKIITSAALLILIVLAGFAAAKMIIVKQIGVGLALSIALDATVVRMLLVPATMTLMGRWNWWAPPFMRRLHARYGLHE